ncbi:MAG: tRNA (N6-isopentenyl adenosine(37)-C2)-methylthiotransferase MiaB [Phycisphaerae bacterium]|nr:tRNA (N6-isopentenyl adenosine(37)-C2)-methylthiotransferase MiaB [Phycisphaerae bacterium]
MQLSTYFLETFGCQMNVLDSQLVEGQLRALGLRRVAIPREADLILFNTCSVRQHAEDKVLSRLGQLKHIKRDRPHTIIGLLGCMAERLREGLFELNPHLDLICGPGELDRLPELLGRVDESGKPIAAITGLQTRRLVPAERSLLDDPLETLDLSRRPLPGDSIMQSYVRVQRGCDKFCTYCVVPYTRGAERSRPPGNIVREVQTLADAGCREVTLLGQTVNSYAYREGQTPMRFADLLRLVHEVPDIDRIRFVTSYPADWDDDIFRVMRDHPRICPYLHIPAQSGSDRILKAMKRNYTADSYLRLMDTARQYVPDIALAGDFIVGFTGETDEDFAATVDLVRRVEYKQIFVFKYSPRPGTAADRSLADDIPQDVKARRNNELLAVQTAIMERQKRALVGRTVEVLVEGYSKAARRAQKDAADSNGSLDPENPTTSPLDDVAASKANQLIGRTPQDIITVFPGDAAHVGALVAVRVTDASALTLFGEIESVVSPAKMPANPGT